MPDLPEHIIDPTAGPKLFLRSPDGLVTKELHLTNEGLLNIASSHIKADGTNEIIVALHGNIKPYIKRTVVPFGTMAYIPFKGTDALGVPTSISLLAWSADAGENYGLRIVNAGNGDIIATLTGQNNDAVEEKDLGTLSNLPTAPAILEVQGKVQTTGECRIAALVIKF